MKPSLTLVCLLFVVPPLGQTSTAARVTITGELRQWHKVTLTLNGPETTSRPGT